MNFCHACKPVARVIQVEDTDTGQLLICDAEPHTAGTIAARLSIHGWWYGHQLPHDQPPRPGWTRHRQHTHRQDPT